MKEDEKPILVYFGDLPDQRRDGITISFDINLNILSAYYRIVQVPENINLQDNSLYRLYKSLILLKNVISFLSKDKVHITYFNFGLSTLGALKTLCLSLLSKRSGARTVIHIHRGDFLSHFYTNIVNQWLAKQIFKRSDKVLVLSSCFAKSLSNICNISIYSLSNTIESEYHFEEIIPRKGFLYLSNYIESKGIMDLLIVFNELVTEGMDISLICYGNFGSKSIRKKMERLACKNISINNGIYGYKKFEAISRAQCLILPSLNEGFPLVILEAMSLGTPVIATATGYVSEMLGQSYPYLYPPGDHNALKTMIRQMTLSDHTELGKQISKTYYENFCQEKHSERIMQVFDSF